jgi:predicted protein tyrosine phosphatase
MPFIENIARDDCKHGWHTDPGKESVLIQIADPDTFHPIPHYPFSPDRVFQFHFWDEEDHSTRRPENEKFQDDQAQRIVGILIRAINENRNVIVHCHAGICRSGAVVEVGVMLGFTPTNRFRQPNMRVKHKLMKQLGWTYDSDEPSYVVGGVMSAGGILIPYDGEYK